MKIMMETLTEKNKRSKNIKQTIVNWDEKI